MGEWFRFIHTHKHINTQIEESEQNQERQNVRSAGIKEEHSIKHPNISTKRLLQGSQKKKKKTIRQIKTRKIDEN